MKEPSPFEHYADATKNFNVAEDNQVWRQHCLAKFDWVRREYEQSIHVSTAASLAALADKRATVGTHEDTLSNLLMEK